MPCSSTGPTGACIPLPYVSGNGIIFNAPGSPGAYGTYIAVADGTPGSSSSFSSAQGMLSLCCIPQLFFLKSGLLPELETSAAPSTFPLLNVQHPLPTLTAS